ncbi:MAG: hypothetical protein ACJAYU_004848 [Bradymonadia bacterium]
MRKMGLAPGFRQVQGETPQPRPAFGLSRNWRDAWFDAARLVEIVSRLPGRRLQAVGEGKPILSGRVLHRPAKAERIQPIVWVSVWI